ncbi:MAG: hypothetical protein DME54_08635 [Verrucomicrobia bacterium]|nr:MAG: hypothetical protein DME54_08635 [Verrucomicrobiota bacterium]
MNTREWEPRREGVMQSAAAGICDTPTDAEKGCAVSGVGVILRERVYLNPALKKCSRKSELQFASITPATD